MFPFVEILLHIHAKTYKEDDIRRFLFMSEAYVYAEKAHCGRAK